MEIIVSLNVVSGIAAAVKMVQPRIRWHNVIHHTGLKLVWFTYLSLISMVPRYRTETRSSGLKSVDCRQMANRKVIQLTRKCLLCVERRLIAQNLAESAMPPSMTVKFLDFTISYLGVDQRHVQKSGRISVIHQTPGCLDAGCGGVAVNIC